MGQRGRVWACVGVEASHAMLEEVGGLEKLNILNAVVDYRFTKSDLFPSGNKSYWFESNTTHLLIIQKVSHWTWKYEILQKVQWLETDTFLDVGVFLKIDQHKTSDLVVYMIMIFK